MRRIALINQKGGVGKTTSTVNLGAALAQLGRRVVLVDLDPQANLSAHLGIEAPPGSPSTYTVLTGSHSMGEALQDRGELRVLPANIDLSGAELELASKFGREQILGEILDDWEAASGGDPADYVLVDCPPSLGLLSINALVATREALITLQTEFLALQGMSQLVNVVQELRRRMNPELEISGILPCLYDSRLLLAREVLGEIRKYFPDRVFKRTVRANVKLAEAPSFGKTIFEYAPESKGAADYLEVAREVIAQEQPAASARVDRSRVEGSPAEARVETSSGEPSGEQEPDASQAPAGSVLNPDAGATFGADDEDGSLRRVEITPAPPPADEEPALDAVRRASDLPPLPAEPFGTPGDGAGEEPSQRLDEAARE